MLTLIVEDDPNYQEVVRKELENMHEVRTVQAMTKAEAMKAAGDDFDLIFLDIMLKGDEDAGIDIAKKFRKNNPTAFMALMTGLDEDNLAVRYLKDLGADEYIQKPVFLENVRDVVKAARQKKDKIQRQRDGGLLRRIVGRFRR